MISWKLPAVLAAALALATALLLLERSDHATTQVRADDLGRRVVALQGEVDAGNEALDQAAAINARMAAERQSYVEAMRAVRDRLAAQEKAAREAEARIRRVDTERRAADAARRARPDLPTPEEMGDALRDAARPL